MNILVIGGNGFIGSHLIDHLLIKGHNVRVFDISYEHYRKPLVNVDYRISTLDNIPDLYEALLGIDIVFHLASASVPSTSNIDTVSDVKKNLIPTLNILNLSVKLGIKRIIYFSSGGAVYGLGLIGAAIYFISHAASFWLGVLGLLKAIVWPAILVYEAFKYLP